MLEVIKIVYDWNFPFFSPEEGNLDWISWRQQAELRLEMRQVYFLQKQWLEYAFVSWKRSPGDKYFNLFTALYSKHACYSL